MGAVDDFLNNKKVVKLSFWATYKKTILIVIACFAGLLLLIAFIWYLYFSSQFSVYQDAKYNFSMKYPKNWKVVVNPRPNVAVVFMRPKDTALDTFQDNFNVTVQGVPLSESSLPSFSNKIREQMTAVFGKSIKIVEDRNVNFGWRPGHMMAIEAPTPDHLRMVNAWVLRNGQAYILTFLGDMNRYDDNAAQVGEMISSLQLQ
jgi:hypothetical protein